MSLDALLDRHGSRAATKRDASSMAFLSSRERAQLKRKQHNAYEAPEDDDDEDGEGKDEKTGDLVASDSDVEEDGDESDAEDVEKNRKERKKAKGGRDAEMVASARLRKQGIVVDEETGDEPEGLASWKDQNKTTKQPTQKEQEKTEYQQKMRALFDKREGEQFESFHMNPDKEKDKENSNKNDDAWLDEVDERNKRQSELDAASSAHTQRIRQKKAEGGIGDSDSDDDMDTDSKTKSTKSEIKELDPIDARYQLITHMKPGETVLKAVKRLGADKSSSSTAAVAAATATLKKKNLRAKDREAAEATLAAEKTKNDKDGDATERKKAFDEVTDAAQALLNVGFIEIYGETYEKIQYFLRQHEAQKSNPTTTTTTKPTNVLSWEYKWSTDDENKHGPFVGAKMNEYRRSGYFQKDVVVKRTGTTQWVPAALIPDFTSTEVSTASSSTSTSTSTATSTSTSSSSQPPKKKFKF